MTTAKVFKNRRSQADALRPTIGALVTPFQGSPRGPRPVGDRGLRVSTTMAASWPIPFSSMNCSIPLLPWPKVVSSANPTTPF